MITAPPGPPQSAIPTPACYRDEGEAAGRIAHYWAGNHALSPLQGLGISTIAMFIWTDGLHQFMVIKLPKRR